MQETSQLIIDFQSLLQLFEMSIATENEVRKAWKILTQRATCLVAHITKELDQIKESSVAFGLVQARLAFDRSLLTSIFQFALALWEKCVLNDEQVEVLWAEVKQSLELMTQQQFSLVLYEKGLLDKRVVRVCFGLPKQPELVSA